MLEKAFGLDRMNINQCERIAQDMDGDCAFDLCGPNGRLKCKWLDPWFGMFQIEGHKGFVMASEFEMRNDIWCENVMPIDGTKTDSAPALESSTNNEVTTK